MPLTYRPFPPQPQPQSTSLRRRRSDRQRSRSSSVSSSATETALELTNADDSIVLSDLVRTGEASRLRRRGAMRIDPHNHHAHDTPEDWTSDRVQFDYNFNYDFDDLTGSGNWNEITPSFGFPFPSTGLDTRSRHSMRRRGYMSGSETGPYVSGLTEHHHNSTSSKTNEYVYTLICGAPIEDASFSLCASTEPFQPSILPIYPSSKSSSTWLDDDPQSNRRSTGCGSVLHIHAAPRPRVGIWSACSPAADIVVPMDVDYFDEKDKARVKYTRSPCGCVKEAIGCAACGNPLGTRYIPCKSAADTFLCSRSLDKSLPMTIPRHPISSVPSVANSPFASSSSSLNSLSRSTLQDSPGSTSATAAGSSRTPLTSSSSSRNTVDEGETSGKRERIIYSFLSTAVTSTPAYEFRPSRGDSLPSYTQPLPQPSSLLTALRQPSSTSIEHRTLPPTRTTLSSSPHTETLNQPQSNTRLSSSPEDPSVRSRVDLPRERDAPLAQTPDIPSSLFDSGVNGYSTLGLISATAGIDIDIDTSESSSSEDDEESDEGDENNAHYFFDFGPGTVTASEDDAMEEQYSDTDEGWYSSFMNSDRTLRALAGELEFRDGRVAENENRWSWRSFFDDEPAGVLGASVDVRSDPDRDGNAAAGEVWTPRGRIALNSSPTNISSALPPVNMDFGDTSLSSSALGLTRGVGRENDISRPRPPPPRRTVTEYGIVIPPLSQNSPEQAGDSGDADEEGHDEMAWPRAVLQNDGHASTSRTVINRQITNIDLEWAALWDERHETAQSQQQQLEMATLPPRTATLVPLPPPVTTRTRTTSYGYPFNPTPISTASVSIDVSNTDGNGNPVGASGAGASIFDPDGENEAMWGMNNFGVDIASPVEDGADDKWDGPLVNTSTGWMWSGR